ncbi:MAG: hypothetical protein AB8H79_25775 [Myxococcota bacterium]
MTMEPCARCGTETSADLLIPAASGGRVCLNCEEDLDSLKSLRRGVWMTVAGVPALILTSFLLLCIPYLGPFISVVFSIMALSGAWRAFSLSRSVGADPAEYGVSETAPTALLVTSIVGAIFAFVMLAIGLLLAFTVVVALLVSS